MNTMQRSFHSPRIAARQQGTTLRVAGTHDGITAVAYAQEAAKLLEPQRGRDDHRADRRYSPVITASCYRWGINE
jgi:hypothetical protein